MSVIVQYEAFVRPVLRTKVLPKSPELIAFWSTSGFVTGDNSGGSQNYQTRFGTLALPFVYGAYGLITLDFINWYSTQSHVWVTITSNLLEISAPGTLDWSFNIGSGTNANAQYALHKGVKGYWRVTSSGTSYFQISADNVNTDQLNCRLFGRIIDERIL